MVVGLGMRAVHLVAVVGEDVPEARPTLLGHRDGRAEVALHLRVAAPLLMATRVIFYYAMRVVGF